MGIPSPLRKPLLEAIRVGILSSGPYSLFHLLHVPGWPTLPSSRYIFMLVRHVCTIHFLVYFLPYITLGYNFCRICTFFWAFSALVSSMLYGIILHVFSTFALRLARGIRGYLYVFTRICYSVGGCAQHLFKCFYISYMSVCSPQ